jgi:bifunctional non-homologous end joining protein LigD
MATRILAAVEAKRVKPISRNDLDWTPRFKAVADELAKLKIKSALVDGEVVAVNAKGVSDFVALQQALSEDPRPI